MQRNHPAHCIYIYMYTRTYVCVYALYRDIHFQTNLSKSKRVLVLSIRVFQIPITSVVVRIFANWLLQLWRLCKSNAPCSS